MHDLAFILFYLEKTILQTVLVIIYRQVQRAVNKCCVACSQLSFIFMALAAKIKLTYHGPAIRFTYYLFIYLQKVLSIITFHPNVTRFE